MQALHLCTSEFCNLSFPSSVYSSACCTYVCRPMSHVHQLVSFPIGNPNMSWLTTNLFIYKSVETVVTYARITYESASLLFTDVVQN